MIYTVVRNYKWSQYLKLRFPVFPLLLFSFFTSASSEKLLVGYIDLRTVPVGIFLLLFFFHIRLLDEFKDFEFDSKYHPDRPIQSGLLTLVDIKLAVFLNFGFMIALASLMGNIIFFAVTMAYTLLMFREFFVKQLYDKSPVLYLITHEVVFIPLYIFLFSYYYTGTCLPSNYLTALTILYFTIPVTLIEIGRKMKHRFDKQGTPTKDTYVYIWGEKRTVAAFMILCSINSIVLGALTSYFWFYSMGVVFASLSYISIINEGIRNLIIRNNMRITMFCALLFPLLLMV